MRVFINGFGRIGRTVLRAYLQTPERWPGLQIAGINDIAAPEMCAYLFEYDSVFGPWHGTVQQEDAALVVDGRKIPLHRTPDLSTLDLHGVDLVLDGTDNFAVRFSVNAACVRHGVPLVSGAIGRWTGQVGVFGRKPCYRCLVPEIPPDAETCAAVGVIGALAGVIGSMMALEAIKLITGAGETLSGRLLIYDALAAETRTVRVAGDPDCPVCGQA